MDNSDILKLLKRIAVTLQTNFKCVEKCKRELEDRLNEIDEAAIKLGGVPIVKREKRKTVVEALADGIYGQ